MRCQQHFAALEEFEERTQPAEHANVGIEIQDLAFMPLPDQMEQQTGLQRVAQGKRVIAEAESARIAQAQVGQRNHGKILRARVITSLRIIRHQHVGPASRVPAPKGTHQGTHKAQMALGDDAADDGYRWHWRRSSIRRAAVRQIPTAPEAHELFLGRLAV